MSREHSHDPDDAAVWQGVILEAQTKTAAQEYYELFSSTYPRAAAIFYDEVIRYLDNGEFPYALQGLNDFIVNIFDQGPLMRMDTPGIRNILLPMLWALVAAADFGIDPG